MIMNKTIKKLFKETGINLQNQKLFNEAKEVLQIGVNKGIDENVLYKMLWAYLSVEVQNNNNSKRFTAEEVVTILKIQTLLERQSITEKINDSII